MMVVGALFVLLGFSVVISKGPQGWMLVILGLALIIVPIVLTANRRRVVGDAIAAKPATYATLLGHYLADDRLGTAQLRVVRAVESGLGIAPEDVPVETSSEAQFERLRGIDHRNVPHAETSLPLQHRE